MTILNGLRHQARKFNIEVERATLMTEWMVCLPELLRGARLAARLLLAR
jgi:hypothetical protein